MAITAASRRIGPRAVGLGICMFILGVGAVQIARTEESAGAPAGPLTLDACIELGLQRQPALAAARASLAAAQSGQQALNNLPVFAGLVSRDVPIRREQSCLGVSIAAAGLQQAEWETRYAVRRMFYSVTYARAQKGVLDRAVEKMDEAHKKAKKLVEAGNPDFKVTQIDVDVLEINKEFLKTKQMEADVGVKKAIAGLREAIGIGLDYPLELAEEPLPGRIPNPVREDMIALARANRPEISQASAMNQVTELEITAQARKWFNLEVKTFAYGGDIHAKPIPQGIANGEYRPGAIGPEMPPALVGKRGDRIQRASDFNQRAVAVVEKTENLITLEVEATLLKWLEAAQNMWNLRDMPAKSKKVADNVRKRFNDGNATGEEYLRSSTLEDQAQALLNQATFEHALGLAALERVTAGGYRVPAAK